MWYKPTSMIQSERNFINIIPDEGVCEEVIYGSYLFDEVKSVDGT
jgi:hypothetical protein